jgi:hypothetical protein
LSFVIESGGRMILICDPGDGNIANESAGKSISNAKGAEELFITRVQNIT